MTTDARMNYAEMSIERLDVLARRVGTMLEHDEYRPVKEDLEAIRQALQSMQSIPWNTRTHDLKKRIEEIKSNVELDPILAAQIQLDILWDFVRAVAHGADGVEGDAMRLLAELEPLDVNW